MLAVSSGMLCRDRFARDHDFELMVHANEEVRKAGIKLLDHGERCTNMMRSNR